MEEPQGRVLGPATTNFNDYVGTVAADDAEAVIDRPSLYELAQIDRDRYTIVGIELNVDGPTTAAVYAFDRSVHAVARLEEIVELGLSRVRFLSSGSTSPKWTPETLSATPSDGSPSGWSYRISATRPPW